MPRTVETSVRNEIEDRYSDEVDLIFVTITHTLLLEPIRVVCDTKDFMYQGNRFIGFPFDIKLLSDDDNPPKATLSFQNVDQAIGEAIRNLQVAARLEIELLHSSDFNLNADPRTPTGTPSSIPFGKHLYVTSVKGDVLTISGDIVGWDYGQRVWPGRRATEDLLPALFL